MRILLLKCCTHSGTSATALPHSVTHIGRIVSEIWVTNGCLPHEYPTDRAGSCIFLVDLRACASDKPSVADSDGRVGFRLYHPFKVYP